MAYQMIQCDSMPVPETRQFICRSSAKPRSKTTRWIIVDFQTDKWGNQEQNTAIFNNCNLSQMLVMLNSRRYPGIDYANNYSNTSFQEHMVTPQRFEQNFISRKIHLES